MRFLNRALAVSVLSLAGLGAAIAVPAAASASPSVNLDGGHANCHTRSSETCGDTWNGSQAAYFDNGGWNATQDYAALCPLSFGSYQQNWNFGGPDCTPCPQLAVAPCPPKLAVIPVIPPAESDRRSLPAESSLSPPARRSLRSRGLFTRRSFTTSPRFTAASPEKLRVANP